VLAPTTTAGIGPAGRLRVSVVAETDGCFVLLFLFFLVRRSERLWPAGMLVSPSRATSGPAHPAGARRARRRDDDREIVAVSNAGRPRGEAPRPTASSPVLGRGYRTATARRPAPAVGRPRRADVEPVTPRRAGQGQSSGGVSSTGDVVEGGPEPLSGCSAPGASGCGKVVSPQTCCRRDL